MARLTAILVAFVLSIGLVQGGLLSKTYKYKHGVLLEIGEISEDELRLDSVQFFLPSDSKGIFKVGPSVRAEVAVSNLGAEPTQVGIAIALFDAQGRLVGVASGGSSMLAIKSQRQSYYTLAFRNLNNLAAEATSFQISIEPK